MSTIDWFDWKGANLSTLSRPRPCAFALLGIDEYLRAFEGDRHVEAVRAALAERLLDLFQRNGRGDYMSKRHEMVRKTVSARDDGHAKIGNHVRNWSSRAPHCPSLGAIASILVMQQLAR